MCKQVESGCPKGKLLSITDQQLQSLVENIYLVFNEDLLETGGDYKKLLIDRFMEQAVKVHRKNFLFYNDDLKRMKEKEKEGSKDDTK